MPEFLIIVAVLVVAGAVALFLSHKGLQRWRSALDEAFAGLDLQLKKRWEIIPTLVQNVQGYAEEDERRKLEGIILARNAARDARSASEERFRQESRITVGLARLFTLAEHCPELQANEDFVQLKRQMGEATAQLQEEQPRYNQAVETWNKGLDGFAGRFFTPRFSFEKARIFGGEE